jgi:hypothetical protein
MNPVGIHLHVLSFVSNSEKRGLLQRLKSLEGVLTAEMSSEEFICFLGEEDLPNIWGQPLPHQDLPLQRGVAKVHHPFRHPLLILPIATERHLIIPKKEPDPGTCDPANILIKVLPNQAVVLHLFFEYNRANLTPTQPATRSQTPLTVQAASDIGDLML